MPSTLALARLDTPALVLDEARMMRNVRRLAERAQALNVTLRPHLKTAKSTDVASRVLGGGPAPITVSTLAEAEMFHAAGYSDILYAVGIAPGKLARVAALRAAGCDLKVILDSAVQAQAVAETGIPALIEIDSDGHRGGVSPDAAVLIEIGQILHRANVLVGVMTHAGESYTVSGAEAHAAFADHRLDAILAEHLTEPRVMSSRHRRIGHRWNRPTKGRIHRFSQFLVGYTARPTSGPQAIARGLPRSRTSGRHFLIGARHPF